LLRLRYRGAASSPGRRSPSIPSLLGLVAVQPACQLAMVPRLRCKRRHRACPCRVLSCHRAGDRAWVDAAPPKCWGRLRYLGGQDGRRMPSFVICASRVVGGSPSTSRRSRSHESAIRPAQGPAECGNAPVGYGPGKPFHGHPSPDSSVCATVGWRWLYRNRVLKMGRSGSAREQDVRP